MARHHYLLLAVAILVILYCRRLFHVYQARQVYLDPLLDVLKAHEQQARDVFAKQHGCLPPPRIQNQRPLGLDRLEQIFRADKESRLMELFLFHFRQTGNTVEQVFLGTPAFDTIEPANLEALLSTKFKGNRAIDTRQHCVASNCLTPNRLQFW